jgi:hypothetical protein
VFLLRSIDVGLNRSRKDVERKRHRSDEHPPELAINCDFALPHWKGTPEASRIKCHQKFISGGLRFGMAGDPERRIAQQVHGLLLTRRF